MIWYFVLVFCCVISVFSQVLLKSSSQKNHSTFLSQYLNARVITAYALFFCVLVANTFVLRHVQMTVAGCVGESLPYVLALMSGRFLFGEKMSSKKMLGCALVLAGVVVVLV